MPKLMQKKKEKEKKRPYKFTSLLSPYCVFCLSDEDCEEDYGKLITKYGISVHYFCLLFSSGLCQAGSDNNGIMGFLMSDIRKELKRGSRLRCSYCRLKGATIGCVVSSCRKVFHLCCGLKEGTLHQFFDSFRSYCPEHRPQQTCKVSDRLAFYGTANTLCSICLYSVEARSSNFTLRAPCCKNAWFHRKCIKKYASSAGLYFFKCPLCKNKELFQSEMMHYGIYVPDQDASWEKEPGAYADLYRRYTHCDAESCLCPQGRSYDLDASKWEIVVCELCGSVGSHKACKGLKKQGADYVCLPCQEIDENIKKDKKKKKRRVNKVHKELSHTESQNADKLGKNVETESVYNNGHCSTSGNGSELGTSHSNTHSVSKKCRYSTSDRKKECRGRQSRSKCHSKKSMEKDNLQKKRVKKRYVKKKQPKLTTSDVKTTKQKSRKGRICANFDKTAGEKFKEGNCTVTSTDGLAVDGIEEHGMKGSKLCKDYEKMKDSNLCSIATVEEDGSHKTVTIKWRGRKIKILKELKHEKHDCVNADACAGTSKMSLFMEVDNCYDDSCSFEKFPPAASYGADAVIAPSFIENDVNDNPPLLVPVDTDMSPRRRKRPERRVKSVPSKMSLASPDNSSFGSPPILSPIYPYQDSTRLMRSMDKTDNIQQCSPHQSQKLESVAIRGKAKRSLEASFLSDNCTFLFPNAKKFKSNDGDVNSVISVSSNGEDDLDCEILDCEKTPDRVSLCARIDIGSSSVHKGKHRPVYPHVSDQEPIVIDLTDN